MEAILLFSSARPLKTKVEQEDQKRFEKLIAQVKSRQLQKEVDGF